MTDPKSIPNASRVHQSRDFNFDSDLFSSWFRFQFHSQLALASQQSFTAVCKQVAKLPFWETQQGSHKCFQSGCSSLNIAGIYMKYKIFAMHSMTPRFSSPRLVQNKLWSSELRRWTSESTFQSVRYNQDTYKQMEMSEMFKIQNWRIWDLTVEYYARVKYCIVERNLLPMSWMMEMRD